MAIQKAEELFLQEGFESSQCFTRRVVFMLLFYVQGFSPDLLRT